MKITIQLSFLAVIGLATMSCGTTSNGVFTSKNPPPRPSRLVVDGLKGSWAPDGTQLAFGRPRGGGIVTLDLSTGELRTLTDTGKDPAWSPDGRYIAYVKEPHFNEFGSEVVWVVDPRSGAPRQVGRGGFPSWSSDGGTVYVYLGDKLIGYDVDHPETAPTIVANNTTSWYPAISPDGSSIAYGASGKVEIVDLRTEHIVWSRPIPGESGALVGWSPDGRYLVMGGFDASKLGAWILDVKERRGVKLATAGFTMPAWTRSGDKLVLDLRVGDHVEIWSFSKQWIDARLAGAEPEFSLTRGVSETKQN
jgi:Tol biopolymer transport system component